MKGLGYLNIKGWLHLWSKMTGLLKGKTTMDPSRLIKLISTLLAIPPTKRESKEMVSSL